MVGRKGGRGDFHILFTPVPPKKNEMGINLFYRCMLNATDSKLFLCAIRQLPSNVWDDTASILFIDYQQEVFSALTMCATYKSSCCSFKKKKKDPSPPEKGGMLT